MNEPTALQRLARTVARWTPRIIRNSAGELEQLITRYTGATATSGEVVTAATAMQSATVYACVRVLAEDVGKLPLILYRRLPNGGKERATKHPLYRILRAAPNGWQTPISFFGTGQANIELRGAAFAYIVRVREEIRELLPLPAERMRVEQQADWSLKFFCRSKSGDEQEIPAKDLLYVPGLSLDGFTGVSTITYAREAIGLALALEKHGGKLFKNGATPSGLLERPAGASKLSAEAANRLVDSFIESVGGDKALRTALLEEGTKFTPVTMTSEDAQFLETRQYQRTDICGVFRVPPPKIGDHTRSTFNNIEQLSLDYLTDSLFPRLVRWEQAIGRALLTSAEQEEYYVEFLVDSILRADFKSRMDGYAVAIQNGIMNPNEVRAKENMNPREGGDEYLRPANILKASDPNPAKTGTSSEAA